jgi:malonyl-CoA/methylmalonyl-CoA synthetase
MSGHFLNNLRTTFASQASRPALLYRDQTVSYAELNCRASRCAGWLQSSGVAGGDRVILLTADKFPFLIAHLGTLFVGAIPLPLNPRFTREELRFFLTDSGARAVVAGSEQLPLLKELTAELNSPPVLLHDAAALTPPDSAFREPALAADEACLILYSSGTTGWPKGVVHTHANVASSLDALAECWRMTGEDVVVNALPLFHIHGLAFATHLTLLAGGCLVIEDAFEPQRTMNVIGRSTVFMAVPPMYYRLLEDAGFRSAAKGWVNVRLFTCGSAPIRPEVLPELESILGRPVINRYGMTEGHVITSLPLDGPWPNGSVGLPVKGIELKVVGDAGVGAQAGEVGSVIIRGPNLFKEYWNKPEASKAAFSDGWFETGDLGTRDANGFLTLVGRKHDLIITSGYNVYPQVVERVLSECPGVKECVVVGLPDAQRGERVAAAVIRANAGLSEDDLRAWCRERLVHYQQPKAILFVESLPRNNLGKAPRKDVRTLFGE